MAAEGPGIGVTGIPSRRQAATSVYPGSEIRGVPESLTSAIVFPSRSSSRKRRVRLSSLNLW